MPMRAVTPSAFRSGAEQLKVSPGLISGNHMFLTGVTGSNADGRMPADPDAQIRNAFEKIGLVLGEAGLDFGAIAEMTSYHVGLRTHFDLFSAIRAEYVVAPYPAWTAVEVAGLRREGAIVEIRIIANINGTG